jgi:hypothetical protein
MLLVDDAPVDLTSDCAGSWNPNMVTSAEGHVLQGGPPPGFYELDIVGCASAAMVSEGVQLDLTNAMGPGVYTTGTVLYTDAGGGMWGNPGDPFQVQLTQEGAVGGTIQGTFTAMVSRTMGGNAAHTLSGSFSVCRVPDEDAP